MSKKEKETEIMIFPPLFFLKKKRQFQSATPGVWKKMLNELKNLKKYIL